MSAITDTPAAVNLQRLFRRIAILRGTDRAGDAARLEQTELPGAEAALREAGGDDACISTLRAAAEARIEEMRELAEFLVPLLAKSTVRAAPPSPSRARFPVASPRPAHEGAGTASVADLIDSMLAQERS